MSSYSQSTLRITSTPIKIESIVPDSVRVPYLYIKAANKSFLEVKSCRQLTSLYQTEIGIKDTEIIYYQDAQTKCQQAYDTLTQKTIPFLQKESDDNAKLYQDFKKAYKIQKAKTIGTSVTIPIVAVLSFLLGFYLHK